MTKRIYIFTDAHGRDVSKCYVSDWNGRNGFLEHAYDATDMTDVYINNRMTIDEICEAL